MARSTDSLNQDATLPGTAVPKIRITGVNVHLLQAKLSRRFGWSLRWTETRSATLVEVTTDSGLTGWGDGNWGGDRLLAHPELVIGGLMAMPPLHTDPEMSRPSFAASVL